MRKPYTEYTHHRIIPENRRRNFSLLPPVREYGYITGCVGLPNAERLYFQNKLEFCLRISSSPDPLIHAVNDVEYRNSYPHLLIKPPLGKYCLNDITNRDVFYIIYDPDALNFFKEKKIVDNTMCWDIDLIPSISNLINVLKEMMANSQSFGFPDQVDLRCFQLIQELVLFRKQKENPVSVEQTNINRIVSYFQIHCCDNFSLDELIRLNGFSRSSFFRHWAKCHAVSPARYMMNLRIEEARRILSETSSSVENIAQALKFSSATYFCSVFKSVCGCTPLQYRKNKQKDEMRQNRHNFDTNMSC